MSEVSINSESRCPACGVAAPRMAAGCPICGATLYQVDELPRIATGSEAPPARSRYCPACDAEHASETEYCPKCGMELLPRPPTPVFPELRPPSPGEMTFGLKSLFVVMTMLSVLLGIVAAVPGCGVPLAVLALPAWIRTSQEFSERRRRGCGEYTFVEMAMTFVAYVMLAGVCVVTVAAAFLVPCFLPMIVASAVFEGGGVPVAFATLFGIALSLVTTFLTARMCYREIWRSRL